MKDIFKKITRVLAVLVLSLSFLTVPVMAEDTVVDTNPVEGIIVTTPTNNDNTQTETNPSNQTTETNTQTNTNTNPSTNSNNDAYLKESLYDGSVLKETNVDVGNMFERITVKLRDLVENVRKAAVPVLVLAWMVIFLITMARIITGERGASARLVTGLFWITFAYCGIVSAEVILSSFVNFFMGN